jgi:hypothetical protein
MTPDIDDEIQQVISEADKGAIAAIIGDVGTGKFSLMPLSLAPIENFLGVVAIVKGRPDCAFTCGLPDPMLAAIRQEFYRCIEAGLRILERAGSMPAGKGLRLSYGLTFRNPIR